MHCVEHIRRWQDDFAAIRRDLHAHPELGFEEHRTANARRRAPHRARHRAPRRHRQDRHRRRRARPRRRRAAASVGLRADMDALPMQEENDLRAQVALRRPHARLRPRRPHDDAARRRALPAETRKFDGTVTLIFQPGEEGYAGAKAMIEDGLFERFPAEQVYALHNWPGLPAGHIGITPGADDGGRGPHRDRRSTAAAATARIRTRRSTRCSSPGTSSPRRSRSSRATSARSTPRW